MFPANEPSAAKTDSAPEQYWSGKDRIYLDFYRLKESPFSLTPDPEFLFYSHSHRQVIEKVLYGIYHRMGFILLTGEVGTGKTTICRAVLDQLGADAHTVYIINPSLSGIELIANILEDLGIPYSKNASKKDLINHLNRHLLTMQDRKPVVVLIDDAQTMPMDALEDLRLLSNLETDKEKLLQLILVGQPELLDRIVRMELRQLTQRITINCELARLRDDEIAGYVTRRLFVAGNNGNIRFNNGAVRWIWKKSRGIPRLINKICDYALTAAYVKDECVVTTKHVRRALVELSGLGEGKTRRKIVIIPLAACIVLLLLTLDFPFSLNPGLFPEENPSQAITASAASMPEEKSLPKDALSKKAPRKPCPYTLMLGSYQKLGQVMRALSHYRQRGIEVHWCRADMKGNDEWYRLYTGTFKTRKEARLYQHANAFPDSIILATPWAVKIEAFDSFSEKAVIMKKLQKEQIDYDLRGVRKDNAEIFSGAFTSRQGAEEMCRELEPFNLLATVVRR